MPMQSKKLGFACPNCRRDYGSIQYLKPKKLKSINRRNASNDIDTLHIAKREELHPVEYSLRNKLIADTEQELLDKATNDLDSLRLAGPILSPELEGRKLMLEEYRLRLKRRIDLREQQKLIDEKLKTDRIWEAEENSKDIPEDIYRLTLALGGNDVAIMKISDEKEDTSCIIKWNPIKMIKNYRDSVDPIRHLDFNEDFCAMVLARHPEVLRQVTDNREVFRRAFDVINAYRKQFSDRNYQYTYFEWFWIVRYTQVTTLKKTIRMLKALDGKKGKMSIKHIKDRKESILKFWKEFDEYSPHFFNFLSLMDQLIEKDPILKNEYIRIRKRGTESDKEYVLRMLDQHWQGVTIHDGNGNGNDYYLGIDEDSFRVSKLSESRVRIHHSNPNYHIEMEEYKNGKRKKRPLKKMSCTFNPSRLSTEIRVKLHKEGKVPLIDLNFDLNTL